MYWVVYFIDLKKNIIVPKQWIENIKSHKEKFYNKSLNSAQIFTCYYTNQNEAFEEDGLPNGKFNPNFAARASKTLDGEGLYRVKLKAYKGIFVNSVCYKHNKYSNIWCSATINSVVCALSSPETVQINLSFYVIHSGY